MKLLKAKTFKAKKRTDYLLIKNMESRLKKILHIIYKFHVANKKILFIGTPLKLNYKIKQLLTNKKHSFIPESIWMNGIITNSKSLFKYLTIEDLINKDLDKNLKFLFHLKKQANLIVVLNESSN
ncbi:30S ribosomal protein S2, partial [Arcobacter sp.]|uniref:30S ribosomal protein S2 n=1 Tax=Arcobacter sp. TaxID=1872629 RepID=UPI003D0E5384